MVRIDSSRIGAQPTIISSWTLNIGLTSVSMQIRHFTGAPQAIPFGQPTIWCAEPIFLSICVSFTDIYLAVTVYVESIAATPLARLVHTEIGIFDQIRAVKRVEVEADPFTSRLVLVSCTALGAHVNLKTVRQSVPITIRFTRVEILSETRFRFIWGFTCQRKTFGETCVERPGPAIFHQGARPIPIEVGDIIRAIHRIEAIDDYDSKWSINMACLSEYHLVDIWDEILILVHRHRPRTWLVWRVY